MRDNVVYEAHEIPIGWFRARIENIFFKRKSFKKLVVISEALKLDYLQSFSMLSDSKIIVAHDGADLPIKKTQVVKNNVLNVGYVGHLYQGRGVEIIIKLARIFPKIDFTIVGGMERDVKYWRGEAVGIKNINFIGHVSQVELDTYYRTFDILLAPYQLGINQEDGKSDTSKWMSPMKIFEYMSYSKPIIASDISVLREIVNEHNSILVDPSSIDAWSQAIKTLTSEKLRCDLGEVAYKDFCKNYTWDIRAKNLLTELNIL